ncbi:MAG: signal peptide peptidase SppA [Crocinitomicaceae bacterium]|nr:signal peptide peptidase SppA [Crocinitomicaceae bacterium]MCF8411322.1 signal peptide peptidase SppA [Crocinitomicaceae bacterium]MCF8443838.1 signal peptide peptidase SppA [Crocinitomicaceae bacterium]
MEEEKKVKISFWKIFWPTFIAICITSFIGWMIALLFFGGVIVALSGKQDSTVKDNTILHLTLKGEIAEKDKADLNASSFNVSNSIGLRDLLMGFEKAKKDSKIKGIYIELDDLNCGYATAKEIREAINDFEKSGKFVIAYNSGELITQKEYYVTSAANSIYGFPTSTMEFLGMGAELTFFKNSLDKLNVEVEIIRGKNNDFKSAVEPFFRTEMSDSSRLQIERYMKSMWEDITTEIAKDRKITTVDLNLIADSMLIKRTDDAVKYKLLDGLKYKDEIMEMLCKKMNCKKTSELNLYNFEKYARKEFSEDQTLVAAEEPNIAVIVAEGEVATSGDGVASNKICKLFKEAREKESIKTVVFRINSPGGSALASEEIWREVTLTNKVKKVIVSMGDVAASGGYYIAAPATRIFAEPTTITGSIGVFGMIPYTGKMLENYLGITFDRVSTNAHAPMSLNRKLTPSELSTIQGEVDDIYDLFLQRVSEGRKMTKDQVNVFARGRVWTGKDAKRIGLVDEVGGLTDAINYAAKLAKISEPKIQYFPKNTQNEFLELIDLLNEESEETSVKSSIPTELLNYYSKLKKIESWSGIQMRLPYEIKLR